MTLEQLFYFAQILAALERSEHNSTTAQWTVIRMAVVEHREIARLRTARDSNWWRSA